MSISTIFTYHRDSSGAHSSEHQRDATAVSVIRGHFCIFLCHNLRTLAPLVVFLVHLVLLKSLFTVGDEDWTTPDSRLQIK